MSRDLTIRPVEMTDLEDIVALTTAALGPALADDDEPYKIGAIFSITGPGSSLGIPERDTALMLEAQINARGGVNGPDGPRHPLKIVIYDDASDETKAVLAAKKLIDEDRVTAIVGTTLSGTSLAILDTVQKAEVPMVSCAAASRRLDAQVPEAGDHRLHQLPHGHGPGGVGDERAALEGEPRAGGRPEPAARGPAKAPPRQRPQPLPAVGAVPVVFAVAPAPFPAFALGR